MSEIHQPKRLTATHIDPDTGERTVLGELEFGADGKLVVIAANSGYEKYLEEFVQRLNTKDRLNVKVGGSQKFALTSKVYFRSNADYYEGLRQYVRHYDCIELASDDDQRLHPEEFKPLQL